MAEGKPLEERRRASQLEVDLREVGIEQSIFTKLQKKKIVNEFLMEVSCVILLTYYYFIYFVE